MIAPRERRSRAASRWLFACLALCVLTVAPGTAAHAHEIRPALLDITEREGGWIDVTWKVPMRGGRRLAVAPVLPDGLVSLGAPSGRLVPGAWIERTTYRADASALVGKPIVIEGLPALQIDVLLQVSLADGTRHSAILRPGDPVFVMPARESKAQVARAYLRMGFVHILEGADHLLFVLGLLLLVSGVWRLVKTITAFTVAHSVTLGLATLGVVNVPAGPTEAIIALSIVFLAGEIVRKHGGSGTPGITERWPWLVAFAFGLFHGLGFAGALSELGVPRHEVPLALLMFNVGVEAGQLFFVGVVLGVMALLRRARLSTPEWSWRAATYAIGGIAAFWTIERVAGALALPA